MIMTSKKTCVITAVCGNYKAHVHSIDHLNVDGFIFGNATNITYDGDRWKRCLDRYFQHDDPYVEYKYYKCQWHKIPLLNEYDIIVWIDSTLELKNIPYEELKANDMVMYKHLDSRSTHHEIRLSRDARFHPYRAKLQSLLREPRINWVAMAGFIVVNRCDKVYELNDKWFSKIIEYGPQCQVVFPGVYQSMDDLKLLLIVDVPRTDPHIESNYFIRHPHLTEYEDYRK